ncbi:tetratricopeptide repeat protein [Streptomyces inhibens]|uniref:tetratricopeptide repeat protein n=1 Tax=Streptomyces inhibens TaxID=2293571 RepID=UPI0037A12E62
MRLGYEEDVPEGAYRLGRTFRELGRLDDAVTWLCTAVDIHGYVQSRYSGFMLTSLFDPRIEPAALLCERQADDECREQLDVVLERSPRHRTAHRLYAQGAARQGDAEAARAHLRQAGVEGVEDLEALDRPGVGAEEVVRIVRAAANGCGNAKGPSPGILPRPTGLVSRLERIGAAEAGGAARPWDSSSAVRSGSPRRRDRAT